MHLLLEKHLRGQHNKNQFICNSYVMTTMYSYQVLVIGYIIGFAAATYVNGEQEDWSTKFSQPYYQPQQQANRGVGSGCPQTSQCVPLSACPPLQSLLSHTCIDQNRLGSLGCAGSGGGVGSARGTPDIGNILVCCPRGYSYTSSWYQPNLSSNSPSTIGQGEQGNKNDKVCGKPVVRGENYQGLGAQPWVVRIGFRNTVTGEVKYPCAGSILNRRVVLTAAHCALAKADNYKLFSVRVGEYRTDSTLDCGEEFCALPLQDIALSHVVVHPGYEQSTFKDDIALLILRADINYTVTAQPICIVDSWSQPSNQAVLVGWGRAAGQQVQSPVQQTIELPIVSLQQCVNVYGRTIPVGDDHLCAGGQYGRDACEGFGGAPLVVKHSDVYYQVGILSFGSNQCGAQGVPSVYSSVKKYSQWIKENTPIIYN